VHKFILCSCKVKLIVVKLLSNCCLKKTLAILANQLMPRFNCTTAFRLLYFNTTLAQGVRWITETDHTYIQTT